MVDDNQVAKVIRNQAARNIECEDNGLLTFFIYKIPLKCNYYSFFCTEFVLMLSYLERIIFLKDPSILITFYIV